MNVDLFPNAKPLGFIYMFSSLRVRSIGPTNIGGLSSNNWDVAGDVIFSFFSRILLHGNFEFIGEDGTIDHVFLFLQQPVSRQT